MGQHRNWLRASRATFAWGWQLIPNKCGHGPRSLAAMSAMLGVKHRCIAWSLRNASPVGSVIIGPREAPRTGALRHPPGTPPAGPPRGPPAGARGEISRARAGPGPPARGAPRGPSRGPLRDPLRDPHFGARFGGIGIVLVLLEPPSGGPIWGALCAPREAPRAGGPPGGQKSAHFFGYLITLPVGTVWALFSDPPGTGQFWDNLGHSRLGECL